ncbi:MAG: fibronectin type III domain-containing protein [Thermoleophilia bacterium]
MAGCQKVIKVPKTTLFYVLLLGALLSVILLYPSNFFSIGQAQAAPGFTIADDASRGYVTAENDVVKVVWHYKTLPSEYNNRGGGNIYELYDKRTDPQAQRNMVAIVDYGTSGTGPARAGHGGLGSTYVYEWGSGAAYADNGHLGTLVAKNSYIDPSGNAVFEASFVIRSAMAPYADDYRVDKKWVVYSNGQIKLSLSMQFLRSFDATEPTYNFAFSRDYGWTTASSFGHHWEPDKCGGTGSDGNSNVHNLETVYNNIERSSDVDNQLLHSEKFGLYGQTNGDSIWIRMDNGGRGFENGGLFGLGTSLWGTTEDPTIEYSNFSQLAYGHALRFYAWWGGERTSDRYKRVQAGTAWSDTVWIEMQPTTNDPANQIVGNVAANTLNTNSVTLEWNTNLASDSQVSYWPQQTTNMRTVSSEEWKPRHQITLAGLTPGTTYEYQVRSNNGFGQATRQGLFTASATGLQLTLQQREIFWASYSDYMNNKLFVKFLITNSGDQSAISVQAIHVTATLGVTGSIVNPALGDIPSNESRILLVQYNVYDAISAFKTNIYVRANDGAGQQYYYPGTPPAAMRAS